MTPFPPFVILVNELNFSIAPIHPLLQSGAFLAPAVKNWQTFKPAETSKISRTLVYKISGEALVTLGNQQLNLQAGHAVDIPRCVVHQVENPGSNEMAFIEIQTGDYFGEDDIERLEDDFERT